MSGGSGGGWRKGGEAEGGGEPNEADSCPGVLMAMRQQGAKGGGGTDGKAGGGDRASASRRNHLKGFLGAGRIAMLTCGNAVCGHVCLYLADHLLLPGKVIACNGGYMLLACICTQIEAHSCFCQ